MIQRVPARTAALGAASLLAACTTMQAGTPAPGSPGVFGSGVGAPTVVEYLAECFGCTVEYATPTGMRTVRGTDESFRQEVYFEGRATAIVARLRVTPPEDRYVEVAEIWVDGRVAEQGGRGWEQVTPGEVVQLTTTLRGGREGRW